MSVRGRLNNGVAVDAQTGDSMAADKSADDNMSDDDEAAVQCGVAQSDGSAIAPADGTTCPALPAGWIEYAAPESGRPFFYRPATAEVHWDR